MRRNRRLRYASAHHEPVLQPTKCTQLLFAYGTLQLESVQLATFGRRLAGTRDALAGFALVPLTIDDPAVVAVSGKAQHTMASFTGRQSDVIPGTAFSVSEHEIQRADRYEVAAVKRVAVVLISGMPAWVYVDARHASAHVEIRRAREADAAQFGRGQSCRGGKMVLGDHRRIFSRADPCLFAAHQG